MSEAMYRVCRTVQAEVLPREWHRTNGSHTNGTVRLLCVLLVVGLWRQSLRIYQVWHEVGGMNNER